MKAFSVFLMSLGIVIMLWVSTAVLGQARSQTPEPPPPSPNSNPAVPPTPATPPAPAQAPPAQTSRTAVPAPPPAANVPPTEPMAPTADVPPPMDMQAPQQMELPPDAPPPPMDAGQGFESVQPSPDGFSYDPTGLRDPFQPFGQPEAPRQVMPQQFVPSDDPLQNYDLTQLRVVGIIWEVRNPKAMIRDPAGKLHMVFKETKIGRNRGFIAEIREGEVVVIEPTRSADGMLTATPRIMTLTR